MRSKRFTATICWLLLATALLAGTALAQTGPQLLEGDAADEHLDQSRAFLETSGLQPIHPSILVAQIIQVVLALLGVIFIMLVIYAGFLWMTAAGNEDKISKAKKTLAAAVIGLAIVLSAYLITAYVISQIFRATQEGYYY